VTKPFRFEGPVRSAQAESGISLLKEKLDALIVIPNDKLLQVIDKKASIIDAFKVADDVLRQGVKGISDLITVPGLINLDFADVKTVMSVRGMAMMGIGMGSGDNRAAEAVNNAISSPLLEDNDISGAKGVLVNITGSAAMTMDDYNTVNRIVHEKVHEEANIKIGVVRDDEMGENIKVTVIATGFGDRFDVEKGRDIRKGSLSLADKHVISQTSLDRPTFQRDRERSENVTRIRPPVSFIEDDEDQYDIPTFLRKSVD
ncbi:MAG: cell division protein FtsZ, partial [Desulfuromonadales bacterium]